MRAGIRKQNAHFLTWPQLGTMYQTIQNFMSCACSRVTRKAPRILTWEVTNKIQDLGNFVFKEDKVFKKNGMDMHVCKVAIQLGCTNLAILVIEYLGILSHWLVSSCFPKFPGCHLTSPLRKLYKYKADTGLTSGSTRRLPGLVGFQRFWLLHCFHAPTTCQPTPMRPGFEENKTKN